MTRDNIHTCSYECERPACIKAQRDELAKRLFELVAKSVKAEREACAKLAGPHLSGKIAAAIRARGET